MAFWTWWVFQAIYPDRFFCAASERNFTEKAFRTFGYRTGRIPEFPFYPKGLSARKGFQHGHPDNLFVSCVDSRSSRLEIYQGIATRNGYWLDLGNTNHSGQAILGNSDFGCSTWQKRKKFNLLPTVADLFPEILDTSIPDDDGPLPAAWRKPWRSRTWW